MVELNLTKRQQEIFDFVKRYAGEHGYPPTVRDIGKAIGLTSSSTVHAHLANLEKLGLLRRDRPSRGRSRCWWTRRRPRSAANGLPLVGQVAAGQPILAEENIKEYVTVPPIAGGEDGEFVLRVKGDSMKNAGIFEDDYVVVRPQKTATNGEIVVAMLEGRGDREALLPGEGARPPAAENDALEPIYAAMWTSWAAWSGSAGGSVTPRCSKARVPLRQRAGAARRRVTLEERLNRCSVSAHERQRRVPRCVTRACAPHRPAPNAPARGSRLGYALGGLTRPRPAPARLTATRARRRPATLRTRP